MKSKSVYVFRAGRVRKLKDGVSITEYMLKHPDALISCKHPTLAKLEEWENKGYSRTPCGCKVEPDGHCKHGTPSWLLLGGYI